MTDSPTYEFHVSRVARDRYGFEEALFSVTGNVVFANLAAAREFAYRMNRARNTEKHPELAVHPGALNAMGLIDEALHVLVAIYREKRDPRVMVDGLSWFESRLGREKLERILLAFAEQFPTVAVYRGQQSTEEWLKAATGGVPNRAVALEELIMLWLANANPAFKAFGELFDDESLKRSTSYGQFTATLRDYFETRPRFGPDNQNLVDVLRAPALISPHSLEGQLAFIREKWAALLGEFIQRLLRALDVLKEEQMAIWMMFHPPGAHFGGPQGLGDSSAGAVPQFSGQEFEYERFSQDVDWMPRTVLIAKSIYVWLDQLSKAYGRHIHRLDHIPDEELNTLARRGFNSLWLIGLWERSRASQRIKQLCGNADAVASAYSLYDYTIAEDLGGEGAYTNLRERALVRGIRLASDMVPNHMGIDSRWVIEHPSWFLSLPYSPFPSYQFNGPDVSSDGRVEIKIEDHYFDRSDAAVVFRRVDRWTGETRYIYHGNDGTSFPWNDTAQLDYLKAEVREAVIQTILHVARQFPIIRFDAAMTLAKRHYQRLWYPAPGTGGAIPSRAEHGMTREQFDHAMPVEFWREVVDRVAVEAPNTLLLAEAFWMMEGYFVRTLGMHRVYNSAFMNMLRDEENANYRSVMKNTLEFDPEVLKRYVNFMNNPDERTAVDQFGKGDKYFGVCVMMATLPGLPMFGHGQIEGFTERYGMEFRRAYRDESPDSWLVGRHEREISPLLHRRALFAEVREFLLYDFYTDEGWVNEDVFAYSNRRGDERALVVYHNRYATARGWIKMSCAYAEKTAHGGRHLRQHSLAESFGLHPDHDAFVTYRDAISGLEYLHRASDLVERGLRVELDAYKYRVLLDWREVRDPARPWHALCDMLGGQGVPSVELKLCELELKPVHDAVRALLEPSIAEAIGGEIPEIVAEEETAIVEAEGVAEEALPRVRDRMYRLLDEVPRFIASGTGQTAGLKPVQGSRADAEPVIESMLQRLRAAEQVPAMERFFSKPWPADARAVLPVSNGQNGNRAAIWGTIIAWCTLEALGQFDDPMDPEHASAQLFEAMKLREPMAESLEVLGLEGEERWRAVARVRAALAHASWAPGAQPVIGKTAAPMSWLHDPEVAWLIGVHEWEGVRYFVKENYERLLWWMALPALLTICAAPRPDIEAIRDLENELEARMRAAEESGYRVEALIDSVTGQRERLLEDH